MTSEKIPNGPKQLARHAQSQKWFSPKPKHTIIIFVSLAVLPLPCHSRPRYKKRVGWAQNVLSLTRFG